MNLHDLDETTAPTPADVSILAQLAERHGWVTHHRAYDYFQDGTRHHVLSIERGHNRIAAHWATSGMFVGAHTYAEGDRVGTSIDTIAALTHLVLWLPAEAAS